MIGERFSRLTVIEKLNRGRVRCRCDCGTETVVYSHNLKSGNTRSCGCLLIDHMRTRECPVKTHGMSNGPTWRTWHAMRWRCIRNDHGYETVEVCERWNSFEAFLEDMGERPSLKHSIDRIDGTLGYSKENCRWVTPVEQSRNRRTARLVTIDGQQFRMADLAERYGVHIETVRSRLARGWPAERLFAPAVPKPRYWSRHPSPKA